MTESGIYIHIPYCHGRCYYCDFYSKPSKTGVPDEYIDAIQREYDVRKNEIPLPPSTIYIGGGTPSTLTSRQLERIFSFLPLANAHEITIEVNPEDISAAYAGMLAQMPVNRVSMGIQSLNDRELQAIGRRHSAQQALAAAEMLLNAGIDNLSLDLIYGLPEQTIESWQHTLSATLSLPITHLSAYTLMYEPGTRLTAALNCGHIVQTPQEEVEQMYFMLCDETKAHGLAHYEISNFGSRPSQHNKSYWELTPYLGLGAAAHSYDGVRRRANAANLKEYLADAESSAIIETLSDDERLNEYIMIRLRISDGLNLQKLTEMFGTQAAEKLHRRASKQLAYGMMTREGNRLFIPEKHWLIADSVIVELFV